MLARKPDHITVGDVFRALEGEISPSECVADGIIQCSRDENCATQKVLSQIKNSIDQVIDSITLNDMIDNQEFAGLEMEGK